MLKSLGNTTMPQLGIQAVTVPGCVDGWAKLHQKFGKLPWKDIFAPAIYYAKNGYPVTEIIHETWHERAAKLAADANARRVYLPNGVSPKLGEIFRNPELAAAMELIANQGPSAFYKGAIAKAILKTSDRLGGKMSAADLSEFSSEWVQPLSTEYRGWKVYELPPNGQGIGPLEMLNILSQFPLGTYAPRGVEELHAQIEAQKLTFADLHRYLADPRVSKVPVESLISPAYAQERAKLIDASHARCDESPGQPQTMSGNTVYLSVVDREGNIASLIQSVYQHFGSGVVVDDYGFALTESRRTVRTRPGAPECARAAQAALPHHHSRLHGEGRRAHRVRHHGRPQPDSGARPVRQQRGGSRHEYPDGSRGAALHQAQVRRLRRAD